MVSRDTPFLNESEIAEICRELDARTPQETLAWAMDRYGDKLALATSFQIDGMAILDMASKIGPPPRVITVDSGRLHPETYDLMDQVSERYGIPIEVYYPDTADLQSFVHREGINAFYRTVSLRQRCCDIRKVAPIRKALAGLDIWVSGLRRDQSPERARVQKLEIDARGEHLLKLNPLADWTHEQVWQYIHAHRIPYNRLYDMSFRSIGCAPCTRPIAPGQDERAGRWWWEQDSKRECGIHRASQD